MTIMHLSIFSPKGRGGIPMWGIRILKSWALSKNVPIGQTKTFVNGLISHLRVYVLYLIAVLFFAFENYH